LDLRAELREDQRDLGIEALFSDIKDSDFETTGDAKVNSIETCLANVRKSDIFVVILSQRYGPPLLDYHGLSATHLEYRAAVEMEIPIHFYVRDRLIADWSIWKKNGRSDIKCAWAMQKDAENLFKFIDEHQKLKGGAESINNWFWQFSTSVDLRTDLRKRLAVEAYKSTGERMAQDGKAPIVHSRTATFNSNLQDELLGSYTSFSFDLVNVGTLSAIDIEAQLWFQLDNTGETSCCGEHSILPVLLPGDSSARRVKFDIADNNLIAFYRRGQPLLLGVKYTTHTGHVMIDYLKVWLKPKKDAIGYIDVRFLEKRILGMRNLQSRSDKPPIRLPGPTT
jgi:hypothetical protein